jgi:hypothetical protein
LILKNIFIKIKMDFTLEQVYSFNSKQLDQIQLRFYNNKTKYTPLYMSRKALINLILDHGDLIESDISTVESEYFNEAVKSATSAEELRKSISQYDIIEKKKKKDNKLEKEEKKKIVEDEEEIEVDLKYNNGKSKAIPFEDSIDIDNKQYMLASANVGLKYYTGWYQWDDNKLYEFKKSGKTLEETFNNKSFTIPPKEFKEELEKGI